MSLYLQDVEEWILTSLLALKAIRSGHLCHENALYLVSPLIHHHPYNVWKKYAAVSIIFHGCHRLSSPFVLGAMKSLQVFMAKCEKNMTSEVNFVLQKKKKKTLLESIRLFWGKCEILYLMHDILFYKSFWLFISSISLFTPCCLVFFCFSYPIEWFLLFLFKFLYKYHFFIFFNWPCPSMLRKQYDGSGYPFILRLICTTQ